MKETLRNLVTQRIHTISDDYLDNLQIQWYDGKQKHVTESEFIPKAVDWFRSTKLNDIVGWEAFPCTDMIIGCTHYIESFIIKYGWNGFQILPDEYAYYGLMGKHGTPQGRLKENIPLIVSIPNRKYADIRPEWDQLLAECERKNIDIHIDMAWITLAKDISINLDHPNIKSFAMSMSKYNLHWNRIGVRWARQRSMDSIIIYNHYYSDVNTALSSCGSFMIDHIPRDYGWMTYRDIYSKSCDYLDLSQTKFINVARDNNDVVGVAGLLSYIKDNNINF